MINVLVAFNYYYYYCYYDKPTVHIFDRGMQRSLVWRAFLLRGGRLSWARPVWRASISMPGIKATRPYVGSDGAESAFGGSACAAAASVATPDSGKKVKQAPADGKDVCDINKQNKVMRFTNDALAIDIHGGKLQEPGKCSRKKCKIRFERSVNKRGQYEIEWVRENKVWSEVMFLKYVHHNMFKYFKHVYESQNIKQT